MLDLYFWPTPNGQKVAIFLEEAALPYELHAVNILRGEQFDRDFLAISPNNKIPAIVDREGPGGPMSLFESGAILQYLAEKTGQFLPQQPRARWETLAWLNLQVAAIGPMFGQCGHFLGYAPERIPYAVERYRNETLKLYGVMNRRLESEPYLGGRDYTIADMATWPWIRVRWLHEIEIDEFPAVKRWYDELAGRPAVQRACTLLADDEKIGDPDEEARDALFGPRQRMNQE